MTHPLNLSPDVLNKVQGPVLSHFPGGVPTVAHVLIDGAISVADTTQIVQVATMQSSAIVTQENWQGCYIASAVDVFITGAGAAYVLDTQCATLYKYNSLAEVGTNAIAGQWGGPQAGTGNNKFAQPQKVVVDAGNNNMYVADSANNRIVCIDAAGAWHYCTGFGTDHFNNPCGIALDGAGNLYVADTGRSRIVRIRNVASFMVTPIAADFQPYTGYAALQYPFSISVQPDASQTDTQPFSVFVVDWANFQTYNANFPQRGTGPRLVQLYGTPAGPATNATIPSFQTNSVLHTPSSIWAGMSGIYVTDQATRSVAHFTSIVDQHPTYQNAQGKLQSPIGICVPSHLVQA